SSCFNGQHGSSSSDDSAQGVRSDRGHIKAHILLWAAYFDDDRTAPPILTSTIDGDICAFEGLHGEDCLTAYHDRLADIQRRKVFGAHKTITDIIPGALARPLFAEDTLRSYQMPQEACLLDDLQSFLGKFGDNGTQQRDISVVAHADELPQGAQIETW